MRKKAAEVFAAEHEDLKKLFFELVKERTNLKNAKDALKAEWSRPDTTVGQFVRNLMSDMNYHGTLLYFLVCQLRLNARSMSSYCRCNKLNIVPCNITRMLEPWSIFKLLEVKFVLCTETKRIPLSGTMA
jgi:hypothetical protein